MLKENKPLASKQWRLINYRTVRDFLTAEFLHDLYNRHKPEVNSIRFRNTLCILRGDDFRSYAPQEEWEYLGLQLGSRFYQREARLFAEIDLYLHREKKNLNAHLATLPSHLTTVADEDLTHFLSDLHYLALGDIYGINLVQIEHGLNWAIAKHLHKSLDFSQMSPFEWNTQSRLFEKALLASSLEISKEERSFEEALEDLFKRFGHFTKGYGSGVDSGIKKQLSALLAINPEERKQRLCSQKIPFSLRTCEFTDLQNVASQIAELRDKNKALMGIVAAKRDALLTEIAARKELSRAEISRYSLLEIHSLVHENKRLAPRTIQEREHLIVFKREESFYTHAGAERIFREFANTMHSEKKDKPIYGTIASKGVVEGKARLVFSHQDCESLSQTDILVALGTDFDLLHGIAACAGVVTEEGGILSHASVVSRELNKPCLIGIPHLLSTISDGDWITLNCDEGFLKVEYSPSVGLPNGLQLLHDRLEGRLPSKILNLNALARHGFSVLCGICIVKGEEDFKGLQKVFSHFLKASTLIIRGCTFVEDQKEHSFAGASCTVVVPNESNSLKSAFSKIWSQHLECAILVQPYIHFEMGGVAFIDSLLGKVLVESSLEGPSGVVNGKVDKRLSFDLDNLKSNNTSIFYEVAHTAYQIAQFFGYDVDIEWGIEKGKLWILQARPVTVPCVN